MYRIWRSGTDRISARAALSAFAAHSTVRVRSLVPIHVTLARRTVQREDLGMRRLLATAPPWAITVVWALVMLAVWMLTPGPGGHSSWLGEVVSGGVVVAIAGPFVWRDGQRQQRRADAATGPLTGSKRTAVYRSAITGVPPADLALHQAALDLARHRLASAGRNRVPEIALFTTGLSLSVLFAVTDRPLIYALFAVVNAWALVDTIAYPSRQRRRIARLEQVTGTPPGCRTHT